MRAVKFHILLLTGLLSVSSAFAVDLRILIPLYSYPDWYEPSSYLWDDVAAFGSNVPITAIINPEDGPGIAFPNSDYVQGMADLHAGGVAMIGYVFTSYGVRDTNAVRADIDAYSSNALVTGIFLDEAASDTNHVGYYASLYSHIHSKSNLSAVILNPGTQTAEEYLSRPAGDAVVIFENDTGWTSYTPDAYVRNYDPARISGLFYDVPTTGAMRSNVDLAVQRNLGWVYATDDGGANPWDTLPSYWTQLVDYVKAYRNLAATGIRGGDNLQVAFSCISNRPYVVEISTNPVSGSSWTSLAAAAYSTSSVVEISDTNAVPERLYRLKLFP